MPRREELKPILSCRLVTSLPEALTVRRLRNSCARYMTNYREPIGRWAQTRWYFRIYRRALRESSYRIYLFRDAATAVGYGALQLRDGALLVTECVAAEHRRRGIGRGILEELIAIAHREGRDLVAEIWISNGPSIGLHEKAGFRLEKTRDHHGDSLGIYRLGIS